MGSGTWAEFQRKAEPGRRGRCREQRVDPRQGWREKRREQNADGPRFQAEKFGPCMEGSGEPWTVVEQGWCFRMTSWEGGTEWTGAGMLQVEEPRWGIITTVKGWVIFRGAGCQC